MLKGQRVVIIDTGLLMEAIDDNNTLKVIDEPIDLDDKRIAYAFSGMIKPLDEKKEA